MLWGDGASLGKGSVAEGLDFSEDFLDVGVFLGGGGGDGKVSVVVYKLLHQYSSVGEHIFEQQNQNTVRNYFVVVSRFVFNSVLLHSCIVHHDQDAKI